MILSHEVNHSYRGHNGSSVASFTVHGHDPPLLPLLFLLFILFLFLIRPFFISLLFVYSTLYSPLISFHSFACFILHFSYFSCACNSGLLSFSSFVSVALIHFPFYHGDLCLFVFASFTVSFPVSVITSTLSLFTSTPKYLTRFLHPTCSFSSFNGSSLFYTPSLCSLHFFSLLFMIYTFFLPYLHSYSLACFSTSFSRFNLYVSLFLLSPLILS